MRPAALFPSPPSTTLYSPLSTLRVPGVNLTTSARLTQRTKMCAKQIIGRKTNINNGQQKHSLQRRFKEFICLSKLLFLSLVHLPFSLSNKNAFLTFVFIPANQKVEGCYNYVSIESVCNRQKNTWQTQQAKYVNIWCQYAPFCPRKSIQIDF